MSPRTRLALAAAALPLSALSLTACGGSEEDTASADAETSAPTESETPEETESAPSDAGGGETPEWAYPVVETGDVIATYDVGDLSVEVHQVGVKKATETGNFVDPKTNKPLISTGDDLVYLNYVVTNNGDKVDLGSSIISIDAKYDDWPYLGGMDGTTDDDQYESLGLTDDLVKKSNDPTVYPLGPGQKFSFAENFGYEKGGAINFDTSYTPVDAEGELIFDERVKGEGNGKTS